LVTVFGSMASTETATIVPSSWKTWVMPTLRPMRPIVVGPHHILISMSTPAASESRIRASTVLDEGSRMSDEPLVGADLELLSTVLVDERGTQDGELLDPGRERHGTDDVSAGALCRFDDLRRRLIEQSVVVGLEADADPLLCHLAYSTMLTMAPAPTVRPPSRMAKRWPISMAIGGDQLDAHLDVVAGHDHLGPVGQPMAPVTSVVRR
jgi:hypothetical protein